MLDYEDLSLLEGIEEFFSAIKEKCSSDEEYAAELLKARGFLLEDKGLVLSDNALLLEGKINWLRKRYSLSCNALCDSCSKLEDCRSSFDDGYLNELLTSENIGEVQGDRIIIFSGANVEKIFYSSIQYGSESFLARSKDWGEFIHNNYAPKVFVGLLEKFVARYVKAISACGVQTHGSCDGNHHSVGKFSSIIIELSNYPEIFWHEMILKKLLNKKFRILKRDSDRRDTGYFKLLFKKSEKWKAYVELNQIAEFLYNNRIKIRQIRREASDEISRGLSRRQIDNMPYIAKKFSEVADKLFDEYFKDI